MCKEKFMVSRSVLSCTHLSEMVGMDSDSVFFLFFVLRPKFMKLIKGTTSVVKHIARLSVISTSIVKCIAWLSVNRHFNSETHSQAFSEQALQ